MSWHSTSCSRFTVAIRSATTSWRAGREQAQDLHGVIGSHHLQVSRSQAGHGDRERVGVIGLAAAATAEGTDPGREPGRHVEDRLTLGDQPLRQPGTHTAGTLDRPHPVGVDVFIDR